jgi:cytochrome c553
MGEKLPSILSKVNLHLSLNQFNGVTMKYVLTLVCIFVFFTGCFDEKKEINVNSEKKQEATLDVVSKNLKNSTNTVIDEATKMAKELQTGTQDLAKDLEQDAKVVVRKVGESSKKVLNEAAITTKELSDTAMQKAVQAKEVLDKKLTAVVQNTQEKSINDVKAEELYLKCSGCHGLKGEKKALNSSEIIQGWDVQRTIDALTGYKANTYGKAMKGVMQAQVKGLSQDDINVLAEYIFKLK